MRGDGIAIVGMACRYADAQSPAELWENVLARRRAFRRIPGERLRLEDYAAAFPGDPDSLYAREAAVLAGWQFDRVRFRVAGATFRAADLTHWLALDVADRALTAAGFPDGAGLPRDATGVLVGNTLTGEFSRAQLMRLRWPYVRRVLAAGLAAEGWEEERAADFLRRTEATYKAPFPAPTEETLAGGLSNTIAGRICNHFDLHGGGYTVDGACASSLLAVAQACTALAAGDLDVALAGGVDLSLDPFELVGFARAGALAAGDMHVYDVRSAGFTPGEGCGFVVLLRESHAIALGLHIHAVIRGWGVSSDGHGGISRPEAGGQRLALQRAYRRAGFGIDTVSYFEGHGTGTAVGDATELAALTQALAERHEVEGGGGGVTGGVVAGGGERRGPDAWPPPALGTIKANIGHTKAAAGIAGLLKATLALEAQIVPPTTGCDEPHANFRGAKGAVAAGGVPGAGDGPAVLRPAATGEPWPAERPLRAGISAMGFGGVNAHLVIERAAPARRQGLSPEERRQLASPQDAELLLFAAADAGELAEQVRRVAALAPRLSRAELGDLAAELHRRLYPAATGDSGELEARPARAEPAARAALVAATPYEAAERAALLLAWLEQEPAAAYRADARQGVFLGLGAADGARTAPRVGLLFTGQGSPAYLAAEGGALRRRFPELDGLYARAGRCVAEALQRPQDNHGADSAFDTAVAQPAIVAHSLAGLWLLERLGVQAAVGVGHSLGEITALHWAGGCAAPAALRLAAERGRAMAAHGEPGAMASVAAPAAVVAELLAGGDAGIAAFNGPARTVVSGSAAAIERVVQRAAQRGLTATRLKVTRAFHSPRVAAAIPPLDRALAEVAWRPLTRAVASTVTGQLLTTQENPALHDLLLRQVTAPVRFTAALDAARPLADLWIEVGPGRTLADLAIEALPAVEGTPTVLALDVGGPSLAPAWQAVAALFAAGAAGAAGAAIDVRGVFEDRFTRPLDLDRPLVFLANPCESAPLPSAAEARPAGAGKASAAAGGTVPAAKPSTGSPTAAAAEPLEVVRALVAARTELPVATIQGESRLLSDLHMNSITVGQLVVEASRQLGLPPPASPTDYAQATVAQVAAALAERAASHGADGPLGAQDGPPPGIDSWVRSFTVEWIEEPLRRSAPRTAATAAGAPGDGGAWRVIAPRGHALASAVAAALGAVGGEPGGMLLCLSAELDEASLGLFVAAAQAAVGAPSGARFVVVQQAGGGGGFARTVSLERPDAAVWLLDVPAGTPPEAAAAWVAAEVASASGVAAGAGPHNAASQGSAGQRGSYVEARYDAAGTRRVPRLRALAADLQPPGATDGSFTPAPEVAGLGSGDVLLVTGGGKGIGAECALAVARRSGARLAVLGRSAPDDDPELAANLARMRAAGVTALYVRADVTDGAAVAAAVGRVRAELGPVTALLHAAGINEPRLLGAIDVESLRRTLAPKVGGLRNVLAAAERSQPGALRLVVGFGSIIARTGLRGEAEYALANEELGRRLERFAAAHPACRCLALDWSVWSGVGMGERLGTLEALARQGITPISPGAGVAELLRLLGDPRGQREQGEQGTPAARGARGVRGGVVVTGRFGQPPTLTLERQELPLLRFLESPRVHYPGIELVVDTEISADTDPYLADHVFRGAPLFAAVLGLEAMAQAAAALTGATTPPEIERVELLRPVAVAAGSSTTVRVAALVRAPGVVEVALRDLSTGFAADHFRCICRFPAGGSAALAALPASLFATAGDARVDAAASAAPDGSAPSAMSAAVAPVLALDPGRDLYGGILFHGGRFRRLGGYRRLGARECLAEIVPDGAVRWFGRYQPPTLLLGDPAARDAAIHGIQACIPHAQLLPIGVDRIVTSRLAAAEPLLFDARERRRDGDTFTYDLDILTAGGRLVERWQGLRLRAVDRTTLPARWTAPLLVPYLERRLQELLPGSSLRVALETPGGGGSAVPPPDDSARPPAARAARPDSAGVVLRLAAAAGAAGSPVLLHRADGRPEIPGGPPVSVSHAAGLVLAMVRGEASGASGATGAGGASGDDDGVGCDLEPVAERSAEIWLGLLGSERAALADLVARQLREPYDAAATRVWTAAEALRKAGAANDAPLLLDAAWDAMTAVGAGAAGEAGDAAGVGGRAAGGLPPHDAARPDGWLVLRSGGWRIASFVAGLRDQGAPLAFAFATAAGPREPGAALAFGALAGGDALPPLAATDGIAAIDRSDRNDRNDRIDPIEGIDAVRSAARGAAAERR